MGSKIGWGELLVVLLVALVLLGPEKLPSAARSLGRAIHSVKKYIREATEEMDISEDIQSVKKDMNAIKADLRTMEKSVEKSVEEAAQAAESAVKDAEKEIPSEEEILSDQT